MRVALGLRCTAPITPSGELCVRVCCTHGVVVALGSTAVALGESEGEVAVVDVDELTVLLSLWTLSP